MSFFIQLKRKKGIRLPLKKSIFSFLYPFDTYVNSNFTLLFKERHNIVKNKRLKIKTSFGFVVALLPLIKWVVPAKFDNMREPMVTQDFFLI